MILWKQKKEKSAVAFLDSMKGIVWFHISLATIETKSSFSFHNDNIINPASKQQKITEINTFYNSTKNGVILLTTRAQLYM